MNLSISPGKNNVGAYINDINLKSIDQDQATEIKKILNKYGVIVAKAGNMALSRKRLNRAIAIVREIKLRWWRAHAISRVARAFIVLETEAARR